MKYLQKTSGPRGWQDFVSRQSEIEFTSENRAYLFSARNYLRSQWDYAREETDVWSGDRYALKGDCEDFAIVLRDTLLRAGWPPECMSFATCFAGNERHAVLLINTSEGIYIGDILQEPVIWDETDYVAWLVEKHASEWWTVCSARPAAKT